MLDMNIFSDVIEDDLESFNIELAQKYMVVLDHKWYNHAGPIEDSTCYYIPSVTDIRRELRKRLIEGYERLVSTGNEYNYSSTGGFRIQCHHNDEDGYWAEIMYCPVETIR